MVGRIPVIDVMPLVDNGRLPAKATVGEPFPVSATVFREGHDLLGAEVVLVDPAGVRRPPVRLHPQPAVDRHTVDRYRAWVTPDQPGAWAFEIHAWSDPIATWQHDAGIKIRAGVDVELMFAEGKLLFERVLAGLGKPKGEQPPHPGAGAIEAAQDTDPPGRGQARPAGVARADRRTPDAPAARDGHRRRPVRRVRRPAARALQQLVRVLPPLRGRLPRARGPGTVVSGTFATAAKRLEAVAAMGFNVIYLPPIHPIGEVNRKGPNNTLTPGPDDTGSPWAIGSRHGGHDAVHPDLGTLADFDAFVARAALARTRGRARPRAAVRPRPPVGDHATPSGSRPAPTGPSPSRRTRRRSTRTSIRSTSTTTPTGLAQEVLRVVRHWMAHGVRIFRVDNPHTKPVPFWQWLLAEVRATDPDVLFLSEAFTKPPMLQTLGAIGFHQSYTYFTWRTAKGEVEDYLREVAGESDHRIRPNFFVNTPDILHEFLQYGGPAAFKIRAVLAAMGSSSWGVYSGYELSEHVAVRPGSEEYLDSEKYQVRIRDWEAAEAEGRSLAPYLTKLNELRNTHPALQLLRNLVVHPTDDDGIICFSKSRRRPDGPDRVIVVINLDPHAARDTTVHLDLAALGLDPAPAFPVRDELTGRRVALGRRQLRAPRPARGAGARADGEAGPVTQVLNNEPEWFRTAVFYEVLVRSFRDSNADGTGDFRGLAEKLDYLEWLGVDCLWVPPFFTSPLRDGGYDVADYNDILPEAGTVEDFHHFLDEAHKRGIRVIIDFVMNHTSDQHPWFQASRSDPDGPYGDFYVWSDTDELYEEARIIFVDTEPSNWTWDPVRGQYYWHRFFHHQPDLNFDNPKVMEAMLDAMDFWLAMGLDGFRLDAVPYLFERPGTNGENLPETHEALREVRRFVDEKYPGTVLLCEANQWPDDVVEYFGDAETVRRRRVPHGVPLPGDAAHLHGRTTRVALPDLRDHGRDARRSPTAASGASSCATTTS